jgi:hypothetical protein
VTGSAATPSGDAIRELVDTLQTLVRSEIPNTRTKIKWGVPFFYGRGPICYISPSRDKVGLGFVRGIALPDPKGVLRGTGRSPIRRFDAKPGHRLPRQDLRRLLRAARRLDDTDPVAWR